MQFTITDRSKASELSSCEPAGSDHLASQKTETDALDSALPLSAPGPRELRVLEWRLACTVMNREFGDCHDALRADFSSNSAPFVRPAGDVELLPRERADIPWKENVSILTSGGQDQEANGYLLLEQLAAGIRGSASLGAAFARCAEVGFRMGPKGDEELQTPLFRHGAVEPWVVGEEGTRRLLVVHGVPNPQRIEFNALPAYPVDQHGVETSLTADTWRAAISLCRDVVKPVFSTFPVVRALIDTYDLALDDVDVLTWPDLEGVEESMRWLAGAQDAAIVVFAHGNRLLRGGHKVLESSLSPEERRLEGACKSYVGLQNRKTCGQEVNLDSDALKELVGRVLPPDKVRSVAVVVASCHAGGFVA